MKYSYYRSHFISLPQADAKEIINHLSQKVSYASKIIDTVINIFSPNEVTSHLHICDKSITTFGIRGLFLGFSNTSHVDSLDKFIKSAVDKFRTEVCI